MRNLYYSFAAVSLTATLVAEEPQPVDHLVFKGDEAKPGKNKHVVLIAGDEEYRSEEAMPMLAQILSEQGFKCTVLFSMDKDNKFVAPRNQKSLSNPAALDSADAIVMAIRFRNWPEATLDKFSAAFERGVSISAMRTSTHAFKIQKNPKYSKYNFNSKESGWKGGFGRQVLGESWVSHWGKHAIEGMVTYPIVENKDNSVLNGVEQIFCKSDLYEAKPMEPSTVLLEGQIKKTLDAASEELTTGKGETRQPCAWIRNYKHENGNTSKIFTTTMGSADDLTDENLRRLVVNSVYWGVGLAVPEKAIVGYINTYVPTMYGFDDKKDEVRRAAVPNMTPSDYISFETPHK